MIIIINCNISNKPFNNGKYNNCKSLVHCKKLCYDTEIIDKDCNEFCKNNQCFNNTSFIFNKSTELFNIHIINNHCLINNKLLINECCINGPDLCFCDIIVVVMDV